MKSSDTSNRAVGPVGTFLDLRDRLVRGRVGDGGDDVCGLLTAELDRVLMRLGESAGDGISIVATGGYGRRELSLHSDIDLMLLHDGSSLADPAREVFYPLWDAGLRVGHSFRTIKEAVDTSKENLETFTALLTARPVWGNPELFADLTVQLAQLYAKERGRLEKAIAGQETDRRQAEPYPLIEADLKAGRGGLRVFHALDWLRRGAALIGDEFDDPGEEEESARLTLLAIRNALHAATGKQTDRFTATLRPPAARWLGEDQESMSHRLHRALRRGDLLSRSSFPSRGPSEPVAATGRWLLRAVRSRSEHQLPDDAGFPLERAAAIATAGRPAEFSRIDEKRIAGAPAPLWTERDRTAFIRLIGSGQRGRELFDQLVELNWVNRALPEWNHVVAAPQFDPIHHHTVDGHLWRTVDELLDVSGPESSEGWCREFADELGNIDELLLAAFFHDVGKGLGGDHSETGAQLVSRVAERIGLGSNAGTFLERMVRHHLLLPQIATRHDTDDPAVIAEVAELVGDEYSLRSLALLTVADARATGPSMWSKWKSALVSKLTFRVLEEFHHRRVGSTVPRDEETLGRVMTLVGDGLAPEDVERHAGGMPAGYLFRFSADEIARHLSVASPPPEPFEVRFDVEHGFPVSSMVLATVDRPGLLVAVAGVLALHNVSVLDARLATREDGVAIDTFHVSDALGSDGIGKSRWPDIRRDLRATLDGTLDLEDRLALKALSYPGSPPDGGEVRIRRGESVTAVEVRCADRVGLLHDLAATISASGFDVGVAKVDTRGHRVVDVFYVRPTDDAARIDDLRDALEGLVGAG